MVYDFGLGGVAIINEESKKALAVVPNTNTLTLVPASNLDRNSTWSIVSTGSGVAIRPVADTDLNLNVRGNAPYEPGKEVIVYSWGGRHDNEVWTMVQVDTAIVDGFEYSIKPVHSPTLALSLNPDDDINSPLTVEIEDLTNDKQQWIPVGVYINHAIQMAFVNKNNKRALASKGDKTRVYTVPASSLDNFSLWNLGGQAIRPLYNLDMNLNMWGNGPYDKGNPVGTWSWGGRKDNEIWTITRVNKTQ